MKQVRNYSFYGLIFFLAGSLFSNAYAAQQDFRLTSPAFSQGEKIPAQFTCDGENRSPALKWGGAPKGTQSFALLMEDPDAPKGIWVHWILYNLPTVISDVPASLPPIDLLANGESQGMNSSKKIGYVGPCPPSGQHRYYFRFYALDTIIAVKPGMLKEEFLEAIKGHILAQTELLGVYSRPAEKKA